MGELWQPEELMFQLHPLHPIAGHQVLEVWVFFSTILFFFNYGIIDTNIVFVSGAQHNDLTFV